MLKSFKIFCKIISILLAFCLVFSGCTTSRHLKDLVIVEGMGIDEKDGKINITVQTLNVGINNASQTPQGNMTVNTQKEGSSITDCLNNLSKSLSKRMFFGQNKLIVIGKSVAEKDISQNLDYFMRSSDSRADVALCVSNSSAKDIIESKENDASVPCENILYLIENNEKSGLSALITAEEVINFYLDKTSDIYLPVLEKKKDESVRTNGIALFDGGRLVSITDDDETAGFVIMLSKAKDIYIEVEDEALGEIGVKLSQIKCKKSAKAVNSSVVFTASVSADMIIDQVENGVDTSMDSEKAAKISLLAEKEICRLCEKAFNLCRESNSDALRVGKYLAKDDADAYALMCNDWKKYYKNSSVDTSAKINLKKISDNTQLE